MKRIFFSLFFLLSIKTAICQQTKLSESFWNSVSIRYNNKEMTSGMRSWLFKIAERETTRDTETLQLLESIKTNHDFQDKILLRAYLQERGKKENLSLLFSNMSGSLSTGNQMANYVYSKYINDPQAKVILKALKENPNAIF